jgi:pimeloyl-[acyl-carrier protein] methyl ester esterase
MEMKRHPLVLLPGLDGSGRLFESFLGVLPAEYEPIIVAYPPDRRLDYEEFFAQIREVMPWNRSYTLIAESFAGPLAVRFAEKQPQDLRALVICASFVSNPLPPDNWAARFLNDTVFQRSPSETVLKKLLNPEDYAPPLFSAVKAALEMVRPDVLSHRVRLALDTDARSALRTCRVPILYLRATRDQLVSDRSVEEIQAIKPEVTCELVNAPHLLLQAKPRESWAAIRRFLARN